MRSLKGSWRFQEHGDGLTVATYTLEIDVSRRLAVLVRTVRGPVRDRVKALLTDRPVEGLKFAGDTFDTDVCHMAFFADPDGNVMMLHHRYRPRVTEA